MPIGRAQERPFNNCSASITDVYRYGFGHWLDTDGNADYLTLSGSGEPTLHTEFGRVLAFLRDAPIPSALLTNGTMLHLPEVRASAALAQVVKISLSCWDQKSFEWVNRPHRQLRFETIFDGMKRFREKFDGQLWLEVFILSMLKRRPCTIKQIQAAFGLHINEISKALGRLMNQNRIRVHLRNRQVYYASR